MRIITVSREFGSGGRELGKRLADTLGIAYFDREIITALAEKPKLGLRVTIISGITNIILDALFIAVFKWGVAGAAFAWYLVGNYSCRDIGIYCIRCFFVY